MVHVCPVLTTEVDARHAGSGLTSSGNGDEPMSTAALGHQLCGGSEEAVEQLLHFGRQLHQLGEQLSAEKGTSSDVHRKALRVCGTRYNYRFIIQVICSCFHFANVPSRSSHVEFRNEFFFFTQYLCMR